MVTHGQTPVDKASSGPRPFSFPGVGTAGSSSDAQHHLQRPITSRFVEGSMNDRSSRAPPVSFLGASAPHPADPADTHNTQDEQIGSGYNFTRRSLQMARPSFSSFRAGTSAAAAAQTPAAALGTATTSNTSSSISTTTTAASSSTAGSSGTLRRPRSFLAPFWEGVTKRLHRRARSTLETDIAKGAQLETDIKMEDESPQSPQATALPTLSDRPSPDEVFANYQKLMQAGFFTKRAIPATRPGLSGEHCGTAAATTPQNTPAPSCPDRFPPPPPRPAFSSNRTPLSPVAPSPASTPMATTPRGTKRIRADVDNEKDKNDAFKNVSIIAASNAPLSSPTRTPRKISKKLRKSSSRLPGGESLRTAAASEGASNSRPSTAQSAAGSVSSRIICSSQISQNVQVHQVRLPMPQSLPVPVSIFAVPSTDYGTEMMVTSSSGRNVVTKMHKERRQREVKVVEVGRPEDTQEPRKKRRSQGPAVVHQVQQEIGFGRDTSPDVVIYDEEAQEEQQGNLRPPSTTHYHRPLGPHNPVAANRGGSNSRRAPRKPTLSSASSATSASDEQAPISFHYPQRVRVRRPMQAQIVEVKASPAGKGRKRGDNALHEQQTGGYQSKPATRAACGKNSLYSGGLAGAENAENEIPVWED